MAGTVRGVKATNRKRANQWDMPGAEDRLTPLGKRLLWAWRKSGLSAAEFSPPGSPGNLAVHLLRLESGDGDRLSITTVAGYAERARVSFTWLALGVGGALEGPFATEGGGMGLDGFPEPLKRAAQAYLLVTSAATDRVLQAAKAVFVRKSGAKLTAKGWMSVIEAELAGEEELSGVREKP